ncbi:nucleotidyltransferase family protein [Chloracidobacterium sp. D]|jgi:predicted nucleotidyltransferase|uniref:nucleotidyltransferase family protein n=1 Tax=Chloracidobacterium sp. D TaxID=2821536 RepID=UPI001B8C8148|nr:nucleotidyltransferase family protein [Chloracidobacterium sp. D]QUV82921.1 nucleotidyltransferase family protein [Chloracidobacterium sp. D]
MPLPIQAPMEKIEAFCRKWKVQRLWLFGSVLQDDFGPESDVDVLVEFAPEARWSLLDISGAEQELSEILGRPVDLVERQCIEHSDNWIRRRHILESAQTFYVAR